MKKIAALLCTFCLLFSMAACSGQEQKNADLSAVMDEMKAVLENTEMMDLTENDLMPQYGIDAADCEQFAVYIDSTGLKGDEIVLLQGVDEDAAARHIGRFPPASRKRWMSVTSRKRTP